MTLKRKMILILMIQGLLIQICCKAWVPQYVKYGIKENYTSTLILQSLDGCYVLFHTFVKMPNIIQIVIIGNRSTMLSKHYFTNNLRTKWLLLKTYFRLSILNLITRLVHFILMNLYGEKKYIRDGNSHLWHQKYLIPCTKVLVFVACRFTSKVLVIGSAERSWVDVKTIEYGKRSAISSYV